MNKGHKGINLFILAHWLLSSQKASQLHCTFIHIGLSAFPVELALVHAAVLRLPPVEL
jgi:hypothetical protein